MKGKKFFVLSILAVMITMFFTGCSYDITDNFKESQIVAEEFLTTKGYEEPEGYEVRYVDESEKQFYVKTGKTKILFNIFEGKPEMESIKASGMTVVSISKASINEIEKVANDFLNTAGYNIPQEYSIKYLGDRKQLQVVSKVKDDSNQPIKITVTFDISEDRLEITDIEWYTNESILVFWGIYITFVVVFIVICEVCS